jgi:hypothetical protein
MTLDEQRALLVKFCEWCADHGYLDGSFGGVDAFLASRPPQATDPCGTCGHARYLHESQAECVGEPGDAKVCGCQDWRPLPVSTKPLRFWRVARLVPGECWQIVVVDADGLLVVGKDAQRGPCHYERDYPSPGMARDMAEVDGRDSGLPEWKV